MTAEYPDHTPMMRQYLAIKAQHRTVFQHGDFNAVVHYSALFKAASISGSWSLPKYMSVPSTKMVGEP